MKATIFKQGKLLPPTFQGMGALFFAASVWVFITQESILLKSIASFFVYLSLWVMFAAKRMLIHQSKVIWKSGFFPIYFYKRISLLDYSTAVIKTVNIGYTAESMAIYKTRQANTYSEQVTGIFLKEKGKYEFTLLFSGTLDEIDNFIVEHLWLEQLEFYEGIPRSDKQLDKKKILKRYSSKTTLEE